MAAEMDMDTEVWKQVFQELIQEVKPWHKWTLTLDKGLLPDDLKPGWIQCQQRTFARFRCSSCSRSWASAKILVLFHMHWCREKLRGLVKMRVFAQKCKKCPQRPFEVPEFMKDNITRVLNNLVFKILKKCYREEFQQVEEIPAIGDGCLEGPHDTNNCEACLQGLCVQTGSGLPSKSPTSPLSPILLHPNQEPKVTGTCINRPHSPPPPKKVDKAQASTRKPKAQNPTKTDPPITPQYRISKPITTPTLMTQQLPPISSNTSQPPPIKSCLHTSKLSPVGSHIPVLITQTPSPTKSRTEIKVASSSNRLNTGRMSPSSSSSPYAEPTTQNLLAHSIYQVERSPGMYQGSECSCNTCEICAPQNLSCGCCCLILFIFIVGIWLVVKYA